MGSVAFILPAHNRNILYPKKERFLLFSFEGAFQKSQERILSWEVLKQHWIVKIYITIKRYKYHYHSYMKSSSKGALWNKNEIS